VATSTPATGHHGQPPDVRVLGPADARNAAILLARGFAEEPGNLALLPAPDARRAVTERSARNVVRAMLPYGTVHAAIVAGDLAAIALWHPPGVRTTSVTGVVRNLADQLPNASTMARAFPHAASVLLRDVPEGIRLVRERGRGVGGAARGTTWHLMFLATAPEHRGRGLARMLLDRQLRRCDEDDTAAWLETTDPVNPPIYERFGFETVAHIEDAAWLPGLWVMRREPGPGPRA
jgi:GNAT superfamily N-acetyltransferase